MHGVCQVLAWLTALGLAHPHFVPYLLCRYDLLPPTRDTLPAPPSRSASATPASSQATPGQGVPGTTPVQLVRMMVECVRKTHCVPVSWAERGHLDDDGALLESPETEAWDMGEGARRDVLLSVVRVGRLLAWTLGLAGFHEYVQRLTQTVSAAADARHLAYSTACQDGLTPFSAACAGAHGAAVV